MMSGAGPLGGGRGARDTTRATETCRQTPRTVQVASKRPGRGSMLELFNFISQLITVYIFIIIASVIMSWLIGLGIVNPYNQLARSVWNFLQAVTEPALRPIRRLLPNFGSIDLSPLVLLLAMQFVQQVILPNLYRALAG